MALYYLPVRVLHYSLMFIYLILFIKKFLYIITIYVHLYFIYRNFYSLFHLFVPI